MVHPTQKPVDLIKKMISKYTNENAVILDPFLGSGTTAIAALKTNRHYIGFEINPDYFDVACKRLDRYKTGVET